MAAKVKTCGTCNVQVSEDYVEFSCPKCLTNAIIRCGHCRQTSKDYTCSACGFVGP